MPDITPPTAFVSHSSLDQDRFVRKFATRLREGGIEAWYAEWEIGPGDSLVERIAQGINAQAFIVVVSKNSLNSKWVREELNMGFVRRVEDKCLLIPILLDGVKPLGEHRHIVWTRIDDLNNYDEQFDKIRDNIFGVFAANRKPPVGAPPAYTLDTAVVPDGLTQLDFFFLSQVFEAQREDIGLIPDTGELADEASQKGWSHRKIVNSVKSLGEEGYLTLHWYLDRSDLPGNIGLTLRGWETMFRATNEKYDDALKALATHLVSHADDYDGKGHRSLAKAIGEDEHFTMHLLDVLESYGLIGLSKAMGPSYHVKSVKARLERAVEDGRFGF